MSDLRAGGPARPTPARPTPPGRPAQVARSRPDPGPLRIAIGLTGVTAASAIVTALLAPTGTDAGVTQAAVSLPAAPVPVVRHVTQYVQLKPGQTAPPKAVVKQAPAPKPRVVVVTTRQSGTP